MYRGYVSDSLAIEIVCMLCFLGYEMNDSINFAFTMKINQ